MAEVRLVQVTKRFGTVLAVDHVSLTVPDGSFTTLLGPSGCGKTTTLRMVAGFHEPDSGEIFIGPTRVNDVPPYRRHTAMVFQEYALFPHMTVEENVAYGLVRRHAASSQIRSRVEATLALVGLTGVNRKFPAQLSGGQQQRVALARALIVEPEVLLLDEPLSNLDAKLRVRVRAEIRLLQQQLGKTTIYVTHDQEEALSMSDRIAVMDQGQILQLGTPQEIYHRPSHPFVADFVGLTNFVNATVVGPGRVSAAGMDLMVERDRPPGTRLVLLMRPETIQMSAHLPQAGGNVVQGRITRMSFLGTLARYWVDVGGHEWMVDVPAPGAEVLEGSVYLQIPKERIHILEGDGAS